VCRALASDRFNSFKQPSVIRPCLFRRRVRLSFFVSLEPEGAERRPAHQRIHATHGKPACTASLMRSGVDIPAWDAAPSGAPLAAILGLGTVLPGTDGAFTRLRAAPLDLSRTAFAALCRAASSHRRQPHVVGADGDPCLPGRGCEPRRRRRTSLRQTRRLMMTPPDEQGDCWSIFVWKKVEK
jgi:hypothetical protein